MFIIYCFFVMLVATVVFHCISIGQNSEFSLSEKLQNNYVD